MTANSALNLALETGLDCSGNGKYGYDTSRLMWQGSGGPSLHRQAVADIATRGLYLGMLGLNPPPLSLTSVENQIPNSTQDLQDARMIPSLPWSYNAGNQYRPGTVVGSLTLGIRLLSLCAQRLVLPVHTGGSA